MFKRLCVHTILFATCLRPFAAVSQTIERPDPQVKFNNSRISILVSQIGYAVHGRRVAFLYAHNLQDGAAVVHFQIVNQNGQTVLQRKPIFFGKWVEGYFWKLDFSDLDREGIYRLKAADLVSHLFSIKSPKALYIIDYYADMMFDQMDARKKTDAMGGFIDCGNDIRETNSHVTALVGMLNIFEQHPELFNDQQKQHFKEIMDHDAVFLTSQQQPDGLILGGYWGGIK